MQEPPKSLEELDLRMLRASTGGKDIGTLAVEVGLTDKGKIATAEQQNAVWRSLDRIKNQKR